MKAIILAAGKGSRISDKIEGVPKSTLTLKDGTPIIRRNVENMIESGIKPIVCIGYKKEKIMDALAGLDIAYYDNPFYSITNNIVSLWFAREELSGDDILLTSADLYYPKSFLKKMMNSKSDLSMAVDSSRIETGDFYFSLSEDGFIRKYGPDTPLKERNFEYMGISKISLNFVGKVRERVGQYVEEEMFNKYFEDMLINFNMKDRVRIEFIDVAGDFWREFDFYEDYLAILKHEEEI